MPVEDTLSLVGITVADKYSVESLVGEGGFAVVYRALHKIWKRPVALKVFKALGEVPPEDRERLLEDFIREGALLADLSEKSASICQARDVGMLTSPTGITVPYMVLEWLEGRSLETVLLEEREAGLPSRSVEDAVRLIEPAAEALALAHKQGVAHRDVKPANLFLLGDPRGDVCPIKLLDFGIAKVVQDAQKMGGAFTKTSGQITSFTPAYGAPEQFSRSYGSTGPWTDVFALALVLVEMMTGKPPLEGDDFMQIAYASADKTVRPTPRTRGAGVTDPVEAVFLAALAVSPSDRYRTVGPFWNALRVALGVDPLKGLEMASGVGLPGGRMSAPVVTPHSPRASTGGAPPPSLRANVPLSQASPYAVTPPASQANAPVFPSKTEVSAPSLLGAPAVPSSGEREVGALLSTSTTQRRPEGSRSFAAVAVGAVGFIALGGLLGAYLFTRTGAAKDASSASTAGSSASVASAASAAAPASAVASASAPVAAGPTCPGGMVYVPGGSFFMGSDEPSDLPQEKPSHQVKLSPFCIDVTEVTTEAYVKCSDDGKCLRASKVNNWDGIKKHDNEVYDPLCNERDAAEKAKHPINCVDWKMATDYCDAKGGRLPTEAEWEFAARGPDGRRYPWGDEDPTGGHLNACGSECVAWGKANHVELKAMYSADDHYPTTAPVGSFPNGKSRYGLQDVVGNVWEWVSDYSAPYTDEAQTDPKGPKEGTTRVIRGGAWNGAEPSWVRPTFRYWRDPKAKVYAIGFRCAANPK
jgi:formylglycine-generating enzyme required for sulfatase activity/serine/threonine protein kinase